METTVIEAGRAERHYWRDLWNYRELVSFLAWRDVQVRYKQAVLGVAWAVIQPAVQTMLLTFVFSKLAKMPAGNLPYPLIVLSGLLPWLLFSSAFSGASGSVVNNANLISKVYFPRLLIPIASLGVALIDFAILLMLTFSLSIVLGVWPGWHLLFLPLFVALALLIALGAGLWITALTVRFRDFRFITGFILQIGLFVTPVGYRTDFLPNWQLLLALNPLSGVVDGVRWCILGGETALYLPGIGMSVVIALLLLGTGVWYFRRMERDFADVI